jgi:hypothetical protein
MKIWMAFLVIAVVSLLFAGCSGKEVQNGLLQGNVTIGPLTPVEREGEDTPVPCEVYEARKIMVYDKNGNKLVTQVNIDCDGRYSTELQPGIYVVDINRIGIDSSSDVPKKVEIKSGEVVKLDIDIDTGIR